METNCQLSNKHFPAERSWKFLLPWIALASLAMVIVLWRLGIFHDGTDVARVIGALIAMGLIAWFFIGIPGICVHVLKPIGGEAEEPARKRKEKEERAKSKKEEDKKWVRREIQIREQEGVRDRVRMIYYRPLTHRDNEIWREFNNRGEVEGNHVDTFWVKRSSPEMNPSA